jgi:hypothetical protein
MHPFLVKSFPKTPRTRSEASQFDGSHDYKTKQTTFLHRQIMGYFSFPIFYVAITWANHDHLQEESAKFGYRFERKLKTFKNPPNFD